MPPTPLSFPGMSTEQDRLQNRKLFTAFMELQIVHDRANRKGFENVLKIPGGCAFIQRIQTFLHELKSFKHKHQDFSVGIRQGELWAPNLES